MEAENNKKNITFSSRNEQSNRFKVDLQNSAIFRNGQSVYSMIY